ncbi:MAG: right-handed parallel beta-helix repeat-containing protein [Acidobacteriota bacterium]
MARLCLGALIAAVVAGSAVHAQLPGRNVNMVSGLDWPNGDPFLQRQNEPSIAASTRNPLHLVGGSNDYRTVDVPGLPDGSETGDAWLGVYKSQDGGQRWTSTLLPGYPQDTSPEGLASPLKGYQAGADPVVRAGVSGLFLYSGLVFDRGENGRSGIFVARFIDNNNREDRDSTTYLGASMVAQANGAAFLDKPWLAVDIPRGAPRTCTLPVGNVTAPAAAPRAKGKGATRRAKKTTQGIPAGTAYVVYSSITRHGAGLRSEILLSRSFDCGVTWSAPIRVSRPEDEINQGATLAIDPANGAVYIAWRRFATASAPDADGILVARLSPGAARVLPPGVARKLQRVARKGGQGAPDPSRIFEHRRPKTSEPTNISEFDQGTSIFSFRTNAYPTMVVDGDQRVYVAWSERGFAAARPDPISGDARIVMSTSLDGRTFSAPRAVDDGPFIDANGLPQPLQGHQLMPALTFAGGRLMLIYYDLRETASQTFSRFISDQLTANGLRHTLDLRSVMGTPGEPPTFAPSVKVSDYLMGYRSATGQLEQLQVNPPNLPMFRQGTAAFIGDYLDIQPAPAFVSDGKGKWRYNTAAGTTPPIFHAVWTDNRDVRPPVAGDWTRYTPATRDPNVPPGPSVFDPSQTVLQCEPGNAGSRNQNIYTSRITGGLLAGSPGNTKPLSPTLQRAFVVFAQNATAETRAFRMTILAQPPGGRASFDQFPQPPYLATDPPPRTSIDMLIPPKSTATRTVYVTSSDPKGQLSVDVSEIAGVGGVAVPAGLESRVLLNPDIENPDIENPDIENPDIENPDIENAEVYNPDIENPDIENPDIENPDIENPDIENPDIENVVVANPDIENPDIENPDIENPDIENPDIENPDIENPDIENGTITDLSWNVTNTGNTTSAFNVNLFLAQQNLPAGVKTQLILHKLYKTPVTRPNGCELAFETRNVLLANIPNPRFVLPTDGTLPDQNDPAETNASMWLAPGERGTITLRVIDDDTSNNLIVINSKGEPVSVDPAFAPQQSVEPGVASQGVDPQDPPGSTTPPIKTPSGSNLFFLQQPTLALPGVPIAPAVTVQVRDNASGVPVPGALVTLLLASNPGAAALAGNVATTGPDGIATFPFLSVSAPGSGYVLMAEAAVAGEATALSVPFDVIIPTIVTNTADGGFGSLRFALAYANGTPGPHTISFAIPGASPAAPAIITPASPLPPVGNGIAIDGTTQPGYDGLPVVGINGTAAGGGVGFHLVGSGSTIRGLAITNFKGAGGYGVWITGGSNQVLDNLIGTNRAGAALLGNRFGVVAYGPFATIDRNVVASSEADGILLAGPGAEGHAVRFNTIGLAADGVTARGNAGNGITMYNGAPSAFVGGNVISRNTGWGLEVQHSGALAPVSGLQVRSNTIGLTAAGAAAANGAGGIRLIRSESAVVGAGNVVSGNAGPGLVIAGSSSTPAVIRGNLIGTTPDGLAARPNRFEGIVSYSPVHIGGTTLADRNIISGNGLAAAAAGTGIALRGSETSGTVVEGNLIGLAADGVTALGNGYSGITAFSAYRVLIGGTSPGAGNVIAGNPAHGVAIYTVGGTEPERITVIGNSIYGNGGLGIDLGADGVTPNDANDADVGPNLRQNVPVIASATIEGASVRLFGGLHSTPEATFTIHVYRNTTCDPSGSGEGQFPVGSFVKATTASGNLTFDFLAPGPQPAGTVYTATATDSDGNTSEFSACAVTVPPPALPLMSTMVVPGSAGGGSNSNRLDTGGTVPVSAGFVADGQLVHIAATGTVTWYLNPGDLAGPGGPLTNVVGTGGDFLAPALPAITLVARIGTGPWQLVGAGPTVLGGPGQSGVLQFAVNDSYYDDNGGSFSVTVTRVQQMPGTTTYFAFVPAFGTPWTTSEAACVTAGGHLASIRSAAENAFVSSVVDPGDVGGITAYIGGYRVGVGFAWSDGAAFSYTNWRAGEPNNQGGIENVIQFWPDNNGGFSGWNDIPDFGFGDVGYVCRFGS